ncbi:hypothetical protein GOP47_0016994 [Adiantum capillus-veneris]|uniref:Uncharacterized protein n=2 Tax=Adiantum capillus-veneris TaxID=13818 RepID=A0A9D4ZB75_ADICA|nr:hypothetical protein GOP47_0016994 [Adiantum capillus-veneris]
MNTTMTRKVQSIFIANPLIDLPNIAPTGIAGKDTDPYIELYPHVELPRLPNHKLWDHCALVQKALNASLGLMEVLCLSNIDLESENQKMARRVKQTDEHLQVLFKKAPLNIITKLSVDEVENFAPSRKPVEPLFASACWSSLAVASPRRMDMTPMVDAVQNTLVSIQHPNPGCYPVPGVLVQGSGSPLVVSGRHCFGGVSVGQQLTALLQAPEEAIDLQILADDNRHDVIVFKAFGT